MPGPASGFSMVCTTDIGAAWIGCSTINASPLAVAIATLAATAVLYVGIPKGFFPQQDNGLIQGVAEEAADISPIAMRAQVNPAAEIIAQGLRLSPYQWPF
ncbi:hypothetical protein [Pseudomonas synxantha]|uniref:hypothetical protein n=1 Tax=Pseudomonas synxantha TaxID=47883 RepID=UPI0039FD512B